MGVGIGQFPDCENVLRDPMADLQKIVDDLSKLTVLEAADLAKMLEEKWQKGIPTSSLSDEELKSARA